MYISVTYKLSHLCFNRYELAEWAATKALIYDPRMIKARYRRAVARHEMKQLTAAVAGRRFSHSAFAFLKRCDL